MSDSQNIWLILWDHARTEGSPFEINDIMPAVVKALGIDDASARRAITSLIDELDRLPDGRQYFDTRGNAAVPLPEFFDAVAQGREAAETYPYEL